MVRDTRSRDIIRQCLFKGAVDLICADKLQQGEIMDFVELMEQKLFPEDKKQITLK